MKKRATKKRKPSVQKRYAGLITIMRAAVRLEVRLQLRQIEREYRNWAQATAPFGDMVDALRYQVADHNIAISKLVGNRKSGSVR